jgi:competence protein ComFC
MKAIKNILFEFGQLFFPNKCVGCAKSLLKNENVLCLQCASVMPTTGNYYKDNDTEKIFMGRINFQFCTSLLFFQKEGIAQQLLHELKYFDNKNIATFLGNNLAEHFSTINFTKNNSIIIPVPLAAEKFKLRGFNQSALIAEALATEINISWNDGIVKRIKNTETQTRKSRIERLDNMEDAFIIENKKSLQGKHIILLDDVCTTGATIEACALQILKIPNTTLSIVCGAIATH